MKLVEEFLIVAFKHILPQKVLSEQWTYQNITMTDLKKVMAGYILRYNGIELENIYLYLCQLLNSDSINVFQLLFIEAGKILTVRDNQICCSYEQLMRWRMLTFELGEELLTTAYLASGVSEKVAQNLGFSWNFVLGHDNYQLNRLLEGGLSENHFHLFGSAPIFPLSWILFMNNPYEREYCAELAKIDREKRYYHISYLSDYEEESVLQNCRIAALIRVFLYSWITDKTIWIGDYNAIPEKEYRLDLPDTAKAKEICGDQSIDQLEDQLDPNAFHRIQKRQTWKNVVKILQDRKRLDEYAYEIKECILRLKKEETLDYMQSVDRNDEKELFYAGERRLLYEMFHKIFLESSSGYQPVFNLFYAYLLLKNRLYEELVQSNKMIGFDNFQIYQQRKGIVFNLFMKEESLRQAMRDCIIYRQIVSLEARITPSDTPKAYAKRIKELDTIIDSKMENQDRFFYVIHFIKGKEKEHRQEIRCRHFERRQKVERQSRALVGFRTKYPELAVRIHGIDAASQEIGCRPEVFATAFRYLQHDIQVDYEGRMLPQLRTTYHVGEDFLDIVDGMRAIEEAVLFLNLDNGDRIGHALALGLDVEKWYSRKKQYLILPQQDYLDNLVWMYEKLTELNLWENDGLKTWIEDEFDYFFRKIYRTAMKNDEIEAIIEQYNEENAENNNGIFYSPKTTLLSFDIHTYYKAWKIRGDDPELYKRGFYSPPSGWEDEYEKQQVNFAYPSDGSIRYIPEVGILYYLYHFNEKVKSEGGKIRKFEVSARYRKAAKRIQEKMQIWIGKKGIAIETNPSSNLKISNIESYDEHPIINFYNKGLTADEKALKKCPQLNVSINTDDQGVFATSLANEYSLMAYALEHIKDEEGQPVYAQEMVMDWLENIKKMGNRQTFDIKTASRK